MTVGEKIKLLRINRSMKQTDLANALGVTSRIISTWETNAALPSSSNTISLAKYFNVGIDYLLGNEVYNIDDAKIDKKENKRTKAKNENNEDVKSCFLIGYQGDGIKKRIISKKTYDILEKLLDELE